MASSGRTMFLVMLLLISLAGTTVSQEMTAALDPNYETDTDLAEDTDISYTSDVDDDLTDVSDITDQETDLNGFADAPDVADTADAIDDTDESDESDDTDLTDVTDLSTDYTADTDSISERDSISDNSDSVSDIDRGDDSDVTGDDITSVSDIDTDEGIDATGEDITSTSDIDADEGIDATGEDITSISDIDTDVENEANGVEDDTVVDHVEDVEENPDESLNIHGFSNKKMKDFCSQIVEGSEPTETHSCRHVTCRKNGVLTGAHVFNYNICPTGQVCVDGKCASTEPDRPESALTDEEWEVVDKQCKEELGPGYAPYCSVHNVWTHPDIISGCKNDVCDAMLCAGWEKRKWRFTWAYLSEGSECGTGKTCQDKQCQ